MYCACLKSSREWKNFSGFGPRRGISIATSTIVTKPIVRWSPTLQSFRTWLHCRRKDAICGGITHDRCRDWFGRLMFGVCLQDSEMDMCTKLSVQNRICMKLLCMKCFQRRYIQVYVAKYNMWSVVTECGRSVVKGCLLCFVLWRHVAQQLSFEWSADNLLRRGPLFFWPPTLFFWPPPLFFWPPPCFFWPPVFLTP